MIDDDVETGNLGPYQERPRIFPNMRSKPYNPLVRSLMLNLLFDDNCYCFVVRGLYSINMRVHVSIHLYLFGCGLLFSKRIFQLFCAVMIYDSFKFKSLVEQHCFSLHDFDACTKFTVFCADFSSV